MFYLIETKKHIQYLIDTAGGECYVSPIKRNDNYHPKLTSLSLLYFKPLFSKAYILCLDHPDSLNQLDPSDITTLLSRYDKIYTPDSKLFMFFYQLNSRIIDVNLAKLNFDNTIFDFSESTDVHNHFYNLDKSNPEINKLIPVQKHFEKQENIFSKISQYLYTGVLERVERKGLEDGFDKTRLVDGGQEWRGRIKGRTYSSLYAEVFQKIEENGVKIDVNKFYKHFEPGEDKYSIKDGKIYTSFNLNNLTTRPSNTFNGINFSALTKESRVSFIPENDWLVEFDYEAYHPRLINFRNFGEPIDIKGDFHKYLATQYFKTEELTEEQIKKGKLITFRQLYGGIEDEYLSIPFFKSAKEQMESAWREYSNSDIDFNGLYGGRSLKFSESMTKSKLFSYIIQSLETYMNVISLVDIHSLLENKKTKIIHYTYDSFLFDVAKSDEMMLVQNIEKILTYNFPVKISYGKNYRDMVRI